MIRLFLVDDHELVRRGLASMLAKVADFRVVGEATSGEEALTCLPDLRVDVVLMDLRMPGLGGLETTRRLARVHPSLRVIAVTVIEDDFFPVQVLKAGARGYLSKNSTFEEVVLAIRTVMRGQRYIGSSVAQSMALGKLVTDEGESPFDLLSERELQVSIMVANCLHPREIADKLCLSPKTVNTYRYRVFEKLGIKTDVELTHLAMRFGLIDVEGQA